MPWRRLKTKTFGRMSSSLMVIEESLPPLLLPSDSPMKKTS